MLNKFKKEEKGEVVGYLLILFAILTLLWAYYPPIQNIILGSDPTEGVDEVTKPMGEKPTTPPVIPPILDEKTPKIYDTVVFDVGNSTPPTGQVKLFLDSTSVNYSKIQTAGNNLRFLDSKHNVLPYWIESWNYGGKSIVWVKMPVEKESTIILVYGDMNFYPKSNGEKTFYFFDDFENGLDSAKWNNVSNNKVSNGLLVLNGDANSTTLPPDKNESGAEDGSQIIKSAEIESITDFSSLLDTTSLSLNTTVTYHSADIRFEHGFTNLYENVDEAKPVYSGFYQIQNGTTNFYKKTNITRTNQIPLTEFTVENKSYIDKKFGIKTEYWAIPVFFGENMTDSLPNTTKSPVGKVKLKVYQNCKVHFDTVFVSSQNLRNLSIQTKVREGTFIDTNGVLN